MATIYDRIDCALEKARWRKLQLRGIYLDPLDYFAFSDAETEAYRKANGGEGRVWPLSYDNELIISGKVLLVKEAKRSAVYATSGEEIAIPKELSFRTRRAA